MLGKSVGPGVFVIGLVALALGCARNIAQDKATATDGKQKGAKPLQLENGEGKASGIVTYPGGDRVDWKLIELPEKKRGTLELKLTWTPPRPGLQLAFDVFDEWNTQIAGSKKTNRKRAKASGRIRTAKVDNAKGKYFVRVYAVGRGDAGKYRLTVEFKEAVAGLSFDPLKLDVQDPPKLAAVPDIEVGCDEFTFDPKVPACKLICPAANAPPGWPACKGKCPPTPTVDEPACWATMACPKGSPDERIKSCKPKDWPPCPDKNNPDESNPNCRVKAQPLIGRIVRKDVRGSETVLVVGIGKNQGVKKGWVATLVKVADVNAPPVSGGDPHVTDIDTSTTTVSFKFTPDQIGSTWFVRLAPP
ncbi:MAG: hypothetical protein ABI867_13705 [Kofleriaceae bacterium]